MNDCKVVDAPSLIAKVTVVVPLKPMAGVIVAKRDPPVPLKLMLELGISAESLADPLRTSEFIGVSLSFTTNAIEFEAVLNCKV